jgi:PAS domain S-box-containing protein
VGTDRLRLYLKQRVRAETELRDSERKYRTVFESSADAIICLDRSGTIVTASPRVQNHLGFSAEELIGKDYRTAGFLSREGIAVLQKLMGAAPTRATQLEVGGLHRQGGKLLLDLNISLTTQQKNLTRWIWMLRNITERRAMEAQLQQSQKMEAIGRLAGGVAHDINNLLSAIMGSASALRHELAPRGRSSEDLDNITSACDRGAELTRNLLRFARKSSFQRESFSLNGVAERVLSLQQQNVCGVLPKPSRPEALLAAAGKVLEPGRQAAARPQRAAHG